jgi:ATP-binding cassette subfamily C protein CydCD
MYFDARLWAMTAGFRLRMLATALLGLAALAAGIARFVLLGRFFAVLFAGGSGAALWTPLAATAAVILLRGLLEHLTNRTANGTAALIQSTLRARLFDRIVALGPSWFGHARTGGVMLTVVDGVEQLQTFFGRYLPQLLIAACAPFVIFAFIACWDLPVALVLLLAALATLMLPVLSHASHRDASLARSRAFKRFGERLLDAIQGLPTLKALGQSGAIGASLADDARALSDNTFRVLGREVSTRFVTDLGVTLGAAAALSLGAWRVSHGDMSLAALLVVLMAGTEVFRPLRDLRSVLHQGLVGQSAAANVLSLLEARGPLEPADAATGAGRPAASGVSGPGQAPAIRFEDVAFTYPGSRRATHSGLRFDIAAGERVAIVGPSGSGKSSLVRLLLALQRPQSGTVRVGGVDVHDIDPEALRRHIAVVAQDSTLFYGTVEDNLRLARPDATPAALHAAARAAHAHEFIMAMPQGYQTMIGERGTRLSGGQRQRLAIARALLRDAPVLVLDEALSAVDAENEAAIQAQLDRLSAGRTTLVLAHRLSSVIGADRILVLDGGRIVETGRHAELLARRGLYWRLMGAQAEEAAARGAPGVRSKPATASGAWTDSGGEAGKADATGESRADAQSVTIIDTTSDALAGAATVAPAATIIDGDEAEPARRALDMDAAAISTRKAMVMLFAIIAPWRRAFAWMVAAGVARVAAFIGVSVLSALVIAALKTGAPAGALIPGLLAVAVAAAALHWYESWQAHAIAYQLLAEMRVALYAKLEALAPAYLLRRRAGDLVALAAQDVETIEYFYAHTVAPAFVAVLVPLAVLVVLALQSWPLALALLPFLSWAAAAPVLGRRHIDRLGAQARQALGLLGAHLTETIQGLADLIAYSATDARRASFLDIVHRYQADRLRLQADLSRQGASLEVATGLGGLAVAGLGGWLVERGGLNAGLLPLLTLLSVAAFLPVSEIAQVGRQLADTIASARRLCAVHDEPVTITDGPLAPPLPAAGVPVQFESVDFTYPFQPQAATPPHASATVPDGRPAGAAPALCGIDFAIPTGAMVALVGASGAGKTTIASLLMRFWDPQSGAIRLDGVALPDYTRAALHRRIALVAQDTWLMNGTLEDNVRLARPDATAQEVATAIRRAALADFVASLPDGLDTPVGERGVALSGGQRQRIAIARAFLRDAPVLILDEATSHLDAISEAQVHAALSELMANRTTLVIAHRLSTIRQADIIVVLDRGRVVERGTHDQLLARRGSYARLVSRQLGAMAA